MKLMRFQVLSLKVLALREVVREGLDYKEHLVSYTRQELYNLKKLSGRFQEVETEMVVRRLDARAKS